MPYTILLFVTRLTHLSHSEFKEHYETTHVPLLQRYGCKHFPKYHSRRYMQAAIRQGDETGFDYDAITECSFENEAAFMAFAATLSTEEAAKAIKEDENKFVDIRKLKVVVVRHVKESVA
ncbi:hypothetical protein LSUE1_G002348 [Lachnellula suecica]|uniref:EthD domain-containing protein n=1 Tax=Lachnellula suecica TaxID=602035 RepID=A0A8T9CH66_9HELO|nr:hypothetical protein LSUE1_G002348 [Lachnellula suecica]